VADPKAVGGTFSRWSAELAPGAKGWLGSTGGATDVTVDAVGDLDSAGFVQVMSGQVTDPDRAKQLMAAQPDMRDLRPDVLGSVTVGHQEGRWTSVLYFTSEAAARAGEAKEMPPEAVKAMEQMQAPSVGQPEFLDLRTPWLDSPK
jgi:hypothetical protein